MQKYRILIVSAYFPPMNSMPSLRPYSWAKYWAQNGCDVTVLTTAKTLRTQDAPLPTEGFKVIEVPVPLLPFLHRIWLKYFKKQKNDDCAPVKSSGRSPGLVTRIHQWFLKTGAFCTIRMPDFHDLWALKSFQMLRHAKWDFIVTTAGPYSVHILGYLAKKKGLTKKWVMDWRDLWTQNNAFPGIKGFRMLEELLEAKFHKKADLVTTVSEPLAEMLDFKFNLHSKTVYNGVFPEDYKNPDGEKIFPDDGKIRIVYTGTLYTAHRDPSTLLRAVKKLHDAGAISPEMLEVVFAGSNCDISELAATLDVSAYYTYLGNVNRFKSLQLQREADLLLFLDWNDPSEKGVLTGKLFEYLFSGTHIMVTGTDHVSDAGKLVIQDNCGTLLGTDIEKIAAFLKNAVENGVEKRPVSGHEQFWQFTRENQAARMMQFMREVWE